MAQCKICKRHNSPREKYQTWIDYVSKKKFYYCHKCWTSARNQKQNNTSSVLRGQPVSRNKLNKIIYWKKIWQKQKSIKELRRIRDAIGHCEICQSKEELTTHHYKPRSEGGKDEENNILVLCKKCHLTRYHPELIPKTKPRDGTCGISKDQTGSVNENPKTA